MPQYFLIISAPSGSGKSTLVNYLLQRQQELGVEFKFSISATTRAPRGNEKHGQEYYFLSPEEFAKRAENQEFFEWEEVYQGVCYGTLNSELENAKRDGKVLIFDVDVLGGVSLKEKLGNQARAIFILPPSTAELKNRLEARNTDDQATIAKRLERASFELGFQEKFDDCVLNDKLETAQQELFECVKQFLQA